ncbi:hypothetical protein [Vallitalea sp.]|jgi:hypothetical protein|uniref:hypothetical protein n=1 Tax=Vallitalea sp. TaxID=1882829 RepID=UPI0025F777EA|nr:hypothetical protein [Vallitalea sp.]MCT4685926.1 hypothetical protein [Vallitalea sp.]
MPDLQSYLDNVSRIQLEMQAIHPLYKRNYPLIIVKDDEGYIYDKKDHESYCFIKKFRFSIHVLDDIAACFCLNDYYNKFCCFIGYELLDKEIFPILCLHEMVHCYQGVEAEEELKKKLMIYDENSPMWEVDYPFNYGDKNFVKLFDEYLYSLSNEDISQVIEKRKTLLDNLNDDDREFIIWQEWKEGLARFLENRAREHIGIKNNIKGAKKPYSRISFYRSGDLIISYICKHKPQLTKDIRRLFEVLYKNKSIEYW